MRKRLSCVVAAALLSGTPLAIADVYRWIDERGTTSYGEKPPAGARGVTRLTMEAGNVSIVPVPVRPARKPPAAPPVVQVADPATIVNVVLTTPWRDRCIVERRVDCDSPTAATFDFAPPFAQIR
jgi:hypothetical protein